MYWEYISSGEYEHLYIQHRLIFRLASVTYTPLFNFID